MEQLRRFDLVKLKSADWICGVDEAGRGALAGPVVAGAVFAQSAFFKERGFAKRWAAVNDSKQLKPAKRQEIFAAIREAGERGLLFWASGLADVVEIAELNILGATRQAMQQAIESACPGELVLPNAEKVEDLFNPRPSVEVSILVDGRPLKPFPFTHQGLVKGDSRSLLIALASIVAKETRDALMVELATQHAAYGFDVHKGYGTAMHRSAILEQGACCEHRGLFLRKLTKTA
jgi:ribonuclease HII|tara:strand:+ start:6008 stop:6709 length:702 start_codon:yes stop_codon:yes gene_type:complete